MSKTIKHTARKIATFQALRDWNRRHDGITHSDRSLGVSEPAGRWRHIWSSAYKAQFAGRRLRHQYAAARRAKAGHIDIQSTDTHAAEPHFTCLYG